jgi:hypothetical protein
MANGSEELIKLGSDEKKKYKEMPVQQDGYIHPGIEKKRLTSLQEPKEGTVSFIRDICKSCDTCQRMKHQRGKRKGRMGILDIPSCAGESTSKDIFGPIEGGEGKKFYTVLLVCRLTRYIWTNTFRESPLPKISHIGTTSLRG